MKTKPTKGKNKSCGCSLDKEYKRPASQAKGDFKTKQALKR